MERTGKRFLFLIVLFKILGAESILITSQSTKEFYSNLNCGKTVVVSVSPQSRCSLAACFGLENLQVFIITLFIYFRLR